MKKSRIALGIAYLVTLVLEILPLGAVCVFCPDGETEIRTTYSYFDLVPFGYANFSPLIVAILTVVLVALSAVYFAKGNPRIGKAIATLSIIALALSFAPLVYGVKYYSFVGGCISACLLAAAIVAAKITKRRE
ncbi:MAG: hypothetical protein LUJ09_00290 [Firmicutes bacterium]|nr:hypothetical protein [Bacillota bacterium]